MKSEHNDACTLNALLDSRRDAMARTLSEWLRIPSVSVPGSPAPEPLGRPCAEMLSRALSDARAMGFSPVNRENYMGTIDLREGRPALGVLCHIDVVPADGVGWTHPPFAGESDGANIYGRGASDNKSAGVAALYAMQAVRELGQPCGNVRLYLGCNEENGMSCIDYYQKNYEPRCEMPPMIVPDAGNQLVFGEWGSIRLTLAKKLDTRGLTCLSGWSGSVPGHAEGFLPFPAALSREGIQSECETRGSGTKITVHGKSCHPSEPHRGVNAALELLRLLETADLGGELGSAVSSLAEFFGSPSGKIGESVTGGALTLALTGLEITDGAVRIELNSKNRGLMSNSELRGELLDALPGFESDGNERIKEPHFIDRNSDFVRRLADIYREFSGGSEIGINELRASTYASKTDVGAAFGQFAGRNPHGVDESIAIDSIVRTAKLLALAMLRWE